MMVFAYVPKIQLKDKRFQHAKQNALAVSFTKCMHMVNIKGLFG